MGSGLAGTFSRRSLFRRGIEAAVAAYLPAHLAAQSPTKQYSTGFPHIAFGYWDTPDGRGYWQTNYLLRNTSAVPADVILRHFADNGQPLPVSINGVKDVTHKIVIPANDSVDFPIDSQLEPLNQGWTAAEYGNGGVRGQAIFKSHGADGFESEAVVPMASLTAKGCIMSLPNSNQYVTMPLDNANGTMGVAWANTTNSPVRLEVAVLEAGAQIGTISKDLPGFGHYASTLPSEYAFTAGKRGMLVLKTPGIITLGFRFHPNGRSFTTLNAE